MITRDVLLTGNTNADVEFITNAMLNNKYSEVQHISQHAKKQTKSNSSFILTGKTGLCKQFFLCQLALLERQ